jgi:hypothetical protein
LNTIPPQNPTPSILNLPASSTSNEDDNQTQGTDSVDASASTIRAEAGHLADIYSVNSTVNGPSLGQHSDSESENEEDYVRRIQVVISKERDLMEQQRMRQETEIELLTKQREANEKAERKRLRAQERSVAEEARKEEFQRVYTAQQAVHAARKASMLQPLAPTVTLPPTIPDSPLSLPTESTHTLQARPPPPPAQDIY